MHAILLSSDLMLVSAAQGAADRQQVALTVAPSAAELVALCRMHLPTAVAIDLRAPGLDIAAVVPQLRAVLPSSAAIVASGPHVQREALAAAQAAGCDEVFTRGQFDARIEATFARLRARPDTEPS